MTIHIARNVLTTIWLGGGLILGGVLFIQTPQMGNDAGAVYKEAPLLIAPMLTQVLSFLFGPVQSKSVSQVPNPLAFWVAVICSIVHIVGLLFAILVWNGTILENIHSASLSLGYFAALTVGAMNFFFVGVAKAS